MKFKSNIELQAGLEDASGSPGTINQILSSTVTGTTWIDPSAIVAEASTLVVIACKNTSGATIAQGTPVYQTGTVGATSTIEIAPADALISANKLPAIGLLQTALNNNGFGFVVITGELTNFTTSPIDGVVPTTGDKVFVKSGGGLTLTKPTGEGNGIQNMGLVGKVAIGNAGSITVSSIMRTNDVPNLPTGRIWVGDGNTIVSDTVYVDEPNLRLGIGTTSPSSELHVEASDNPNLLITRSGVNKVILGDSGSNNGGDLLLYNANGTLTTLIRSGASSYLNGGNVGIGTTSPNEKLDVQGKVYIEGNGQDWNEATPGVTRGSIHFDPGTSTDNAGNAITFGASDSSVGTNAQAGIYTRSDGTYGTKMYFATTDSYASGSKTRMMIDYNGNVGIGTTSPTQAKLVVDSSTTPQILVKNSSNTNSQILFEGSSGVTQNASITFDQAGQNALYITTSYDSPTDSNRIYLQPGGETAMTLIGGSNATGNAGNVGIGTTSPDKLLDVSSDNIPTIRITNTLQSSSNYTIGAFEFFSEDASTPGGARVLSSILCVNNAGSSVPNGELAFYTALGGGSGATPTEKMRIASDGAIQFNTYGAGTLVTDASGNITVSSGGGAGGPYVTIGTNQTVTGIKSFSGKIGADGGIDGLTLANGGITGSNYDITGVNQLVISDPGEGIVFTGTATMYLNAVDDATDSILKLTNATQLNLNSTARITSLVNPTGAQDAATKNYVDTEIGNIPSGLAFEGNWNASTDTPTLAGTTQDNGKFWIVTVAGSTNLSGITDWAVGDWAIYVDNGAGTDAWQKVDNSSTLSGLGAAGKVAFWSTTSNVSFNNNFLYDGTYLTAPRIRVGDGTDGYFYSDVAGRTAFAGGHFYIQANVGTYYNYATNQYHGNSSGDNHYFRGNPLSGNNWNITAAGAATFTTVTGTTATITGNTLLGNSNGDYVHINDRLFVGATDSGNAEFWFGEGTTGDVNYGAHWHWDSLYTHKWFTVNNSTETLMMDYATNDASKVNWYRDIDIQDNDILIDSYHGFINSGTWTRNQTPYGYIDFGPANTGTAHIYTDRPSFYFNKKVLVLGGSLINQSDIQANIFYDKQNTGYYVDPASTSNLSTVTAAQFNGPLSGTASNANTLDNLDSTQFLRSDATDYYSGGLVSTARNLGNFGTYDSTKTDSIWSMGTSYQNSSTGANFGNLYGLAYKHTNNTTGGTMGGGHQMVWCDNGNPRGAIGYTSMWHASSIQAPIFYDSNHTDYYVDPSTTSNLWKLTVSDTVTASNFILSSDERKKTKIKDLSCDNIDTNWKSFEMKNNEGEYRVGVIAQELEIKHPEFVNTDNEGFKSVKYIDLLIAKIAELEARLEKAGI